MTPTGKAHRFAIGDAVRPRVEWRDDPNNVPTGRVREIDNGALYVADEPRAFAAYVFEPDTPAAPAEPTQPDLFTTRL
jgi:hypothetical protein